jgi:DNA gyrase/topoisomerase IV subunit B
MIHLLLVCVSLSFLNKGITITFTDKRDVKIKGMLVEIFHSKEGLKEFVKFLDGNRVPIISHVSVWKMKKVKFLLK